MFLVLEFMDIYRGVELFRDKGGLLWFKISIRIILQGKVDNNLGLDYLAGSKSLDPIRCRQPNYA